MTEAEARETHDCVDIYQTRFRPMKATLSGGGEKVIMKIVVDGDSDQVLGVHIFGEDAGEMAQLLAISLRMVATKADFDATMALHPSAAEESGRACAIARRGIRTRDDAGCESG